MSLTLRPYKSSDYDDVINCWVETWKPVFDTIWLDDFIDAWQQQFTDLVSRPDTVITLACQSDSTSTGQESLAGVLIVLEDTHKIDQLFIHPCAKRRGLGKRLIKEAQRISPNHLWLTVFTFNEQAILFYEAIGFQLMSQYTSPTSGLPLYEYHWSTLEADPARSAPSN